MAAGGGDGGGRPAQAVLGGGEDGRRGLAALARVGGAGGHGEGVVGGRLQVAPEVEVELVGRVVVVDLLLLGALGQLVVVYEGVHLFRRLGPPDRD